MSSDVLRIGIPRGAYAEREDPHLSWLDDMGERASGTILRRFMGSTRRGEKIVARTAALKGVAEQQSEAEMLQTANNIMR